MKALAGSTVAAPSHVVRFMGQAGIVPPYFEAMPLRVVQVDARTATFKVPQELLDQARRLFDAQQDGPASTEERAETAGDSTGDRIAAESTDSSASLQEPAASLPPSQVPNLFINAEATTICHPDLSQRVAKQNDLDEPNQSVATPEPAANGTRLLWSVVICLALAVVLSVLRRLHLV